MPNDRELLEMAAKAAGYSTTHPWNAERMKLDPPVIGLVINEVSTCWNPLKDDGHALRLAVKLGLLVDSDDHLGESNAMGNGVNKYVAHGDDKYAATRRAIVRAAAEIGRGMP